MIGIMSEEPLLLFPNVHKVMRADRICKAKGIATRVIPVPEEISSECGMCLVVADSNLNACREALKEENITFELHKRGKQ
ncbi:DUF3343 domain-containing protein [Marinilabilia salmonicolor]|jgi:hypothetical protein|uniref:Uncharacterized protein DUF3343 n=1 Tax=Marinilabilia salmonicolor TaxID=989 RepID=A0A368V099_9BACT|nr:DUF3343 domain-containing protein [Marinilabilia salmonicolor]RCW34542.1 uncharacterized protein DUF3343 [Marinilabilia salmonicolor]